MHTIENGRCWGFGKLIDVNRIKDSTSGLLLDDMFTVRLDLRLMLPENEAFSVRRDDKHAHITVWTVTLPKHLT